LLVWHAQEADWLGNRLDKPIRRTLGRLLGEAVELGFDVLG
jgi:hypothetical protein